MTRPPVLFLDEPTTGLDPTSRQRVWEAIRELLGEGVTVLLTTQYLEEADELAHRDRGGGPRPGDRRRDAAGAEGGEPGRPPGGDAGRAARGRRRCDGAAGGGRGRA